MPRPCGIDQTILSRFYIGHLSVRSRRPVQWVRYGCSIVCPGLIYAPSEQSRQLVIGQWLWRRSALDGVQARLTTRPSFRPVSLGPYVMAFGPAVLAEFVSTPP